MSKLIFTVQGDSVVTCVPDPDRLTHAQRKAIRECVGILREHFAEAPESTCPICGRIGCMAVHIESHDHEDVK